MFVVYGAYIIRWGQISTNILLKKIVEKIEEICQNLLTLGFVTKLLS